MRQLSKRTQYSLRALYALTRNYGAGPLLITNLARDEGIPKKFLEQILLAMKAPVLSRARKAKAEDIFWRSLHKRSPSVL
jgi:DNA-binding IscR family transcriptional regulator